MDPATHPLDGRGLACPHPVLRARRALAALGHGDVLEVLATDPAAPGGHALLASGREGEAWRVRLRKQGRAAGATATPRRRAARGRQRY